MASYFTNYCKDRILNYYFVPSNSFTQNPASGTPGTYAALLKTSTPPDHAGNYLEIANLDREAITFGAVSSASLATPTAEILFETPNVTSPHTVGYVGIFEDTAATTPNLLAWATLDGGNITVDSSQNVKIATGDLKAGISVNADSSITDSQRALVDAVAQEAVDMTFKYGTGTIQNANTSGYTLELALFSSNSYSSANPVQTEFSGANYSRQAITFGAAAAGSGTERVVSNTNSISFQNMNSSDSPAEKWGVYAVSGGTSVLLALNDHSTQAFATGSDITFAPGDIKITLD